MTPYAIRERPWQMIIGAARMDAASGEAIEVVDPSTADLIARVPRGSEHDVDAAVAAAREAFDARRWNGLPPREREAIMWNLAQLIEDNADELEYVESLNNGMPLRAGRMSAAVAAAIRYNAGWIERLPGTASELHRGGYALQAYTRREPIGVAGLIVPWNGPLAIAAEKVSAALAAGCTCVLKPAEETPLTALRLGELCLEAGVPAGVVNVVTGLGAEVGAAIASHPGVDKVSFTGSTEVGRLLIRASGDGNLKKLTLELGGKSPMIVFDDADIDAVIEAAATAIFTNSGQMCFAASRLFVHNHILHEVVDGLAEIARSLRLGRFDHVATDMGPLISRKQLVRVQGYVDSGVADGASIVCGGRTVRGRGFFFEPTVVVDVRRDMKMVREEIFGPVVCVLPFSSESEVIDAANDTPYGLAGSVWTADVGKGLRVLNALRAGRVGLNNHPIRELSMPTGGYKQSGWGRECGADGITAFLETKSVYIA